MDFESGSPGSALLGHGLESREDGYYGQDGVIAFRETQAADGLQGKAHSPRIRIMANSEEFIEAANSEGFGAEIPKSILFETPN